MNQLAPYRRVLGSKFAPHPIHNVSTKQDAILEAEPSLYTELVGALRVDFTAPEL
jgi:hypothetical protein